MRLNLKNPIAFIDFETTGISIVKDRIIEIGIIKINPNGEKQIFNKIINPGMPIPEESSLIHKIYDKDVEHCPSFKMISKDLLFFLKDCDFSGFNILKFDIPILLEEFLRVNIDFNISNKKIIDVQKIFHFMEKRNLSSAYQFYCKKKLIGAHNAMVDISATIDILKAQIKLYNEMPVLDNTGKKIGLIKNDMTLLHKLTYDNMVDFARRIIYNQQGIKIFNFGKYKGLSVAEVLKKNSNYYFWIMKNEFSLNTKKELTKIKFEMNNI